MLLVTFPLTLINALLHIRTEHEQMLMAMAWVFETQTHPPVLLTRP